MSQQLLLLHMMLWLSGSMISFDHGLSHSSLILWFILLMQGAMLGS